MVPLKKLEAFLETLDLTPQEIDALVRNLERIRRKMFTEE